MTTLFLVSYAALWLLVLVLTWWFYRSNVHPPVTEGYGLYLGAACALGAVAASLWALASALLTP